ncbi:transmembrane protein 208 [Chrysoperla carnea]|uniref:transmembrane protein 208 n=1 Tax=Chrysoperla carnea TaxID=189513 RepID=UPI001D06A4DE|nr:transmembrane protein 208 [Chrysoperla carnea]
MAPQQKGKVGTKGAKQIVAENISTLNYYRNMALGANTINLIGLCIFSNIFTWSAILLLIFSSTIYIAAFQFMKYIARTTIAENGQILDSGTDLNMEGGLAEHVKDLIILTAGCQLLALISNYFWLLWLLAPIRGFWLLWVNLLSPYFFQQAPPNEEEKNEKKQKKLERKMRRMR